MNEQWNDITVIVNSCDQYSDLWYPFFELFRIYWQECKYPIILNTESLSYEHPKRFADIRCLQLYSANEKVDWSRRLKKTLDHCQTEFILMLMDDFFLHAPVKSQRLNDIVKWMKKDEKIGYMCLYPSSGKQYKSEYNGFYLRDKGSPFLSQCQATVWRKSVLYDLLKNAESPWEFEELGTKRLRSSKYDFYSAACCDFKEDDHPSNIRLQELLYPYVLAVTLGYGVCGGKWLYRNKELFEKNGIYDVDFSRRPMFQSREEVWDWIYKKREEANQDGRSNFRKTLSKVIPRSVKRFLRRIIKS